MVNLLYYRLWAYETSICCEDELGMTFLLRFLTKFHVVSFQLSHSIKNIVGPFLQLLKYFEINFEKLLENVISKRVALHGVF